MGPILGNRILTGHKPQGLYRGLIPRLRLYYKIKKNMAPITTRTTLEDGAGVGALALNVPSGNHCQVLDHSGLTGGYANCPVSWMRKGRLR